MPLKELVAEFVKLRDEKEELEIRVSEINKTLDGWTDDAGVEHKGIVPQLRDAMIETGLKAVKLDDGRSLYLFRFITMNRSNDVPKETALAILRKCKLGALIKKDYSASSLAAWLRERVKDAEEKKGDVVSPDSVLPKSMKDVFVTYEEFQPRLRKS
jgi:hypothetical protein